MVEEILKEIKNINSVTFVAVCAYNGEIADSVGEGVDTSALKRVVQLASKIYAAHKLVDRKLVILQLYWKNSFLLIRFSDDFLIVTRCTSLDALSLLRISLNVTIANLLEDKNMAKWLKKERFDPNKTLRKSQLDERELQFVSQLQ